MLKYTVLTLIVLSLFLSACAPASQQAETISPTPLQPSPENSAAQVDHQDPKGMEDTPASGMEEPGSVTTEEPKPGAVDTPAWLSVALTDVRSGQSFSVNDYRGKVVLLETLAIWCSNCKKQQVQIKTWHETLGFHPDMISIGLDIDPNGNSDDLKTYIDNNGFNWTYAVAPVEVAREIGNLYGPQYLNPPSTPKLVIDRNGQVHLLPFGIMSAEELQKAIEPFVNEGA